MEFGNRGAREQATCVPALWGTVPLMGRGAPADLGCGTLRHLLGISRQYVGSACAPPFLRRAHKGLLGARSQRKKSAGCESWLRARLLRYSTGRAAYVVHGYDAI